MSINPDIFNSKNTIIPYFTYSDPNPEFTELLVSRAFDSGASIIEIGIPFSESLADGPVIQNSHFRALSKNKINFLESALKMVSRISSNRSDRPIVFMAAYNLILQFGLDLFFQNAQKSGLAGIIIPDLPYELSLNIRELAQSYNVDLILLVTPQSSDQRIESIVSASSGFVYVVSTTGVTGVLSELSVDLPSLIDKVKRVSSIPVAVGFGISTREQVVTVNQYVDAAIIGSALVKRLDSASDNPELTLDSISNLITDLIS